MQVPTGSEDLSSHSSLAQRLGADAADSVICPSKYVVRDLYVCLGNLADSVCLSGYCARGASGGTI